MIVTPELLSTFPILKPLPQEVLANLAKQSSISKFSRRGVVINAGVGHGAVCMVVRRYGAGIGNW